MFQSNFTLRRKIGLVGKLARSEAKNIILQNPPTQLQVDVTLKHHFSSTTEVLFPSFCLHDFQTSDPLMMKAETGLILEREVCPEFLQLFQLISTCSQIL